MKPLDRIGPIERDIVRQRRETGYRAPLERFAEVERELRAVLDVLLPGVPPGIDLAAFVDSNTGVALGRGDRRRGLPPEGELFTTGLDALRRTGFAAADDGSRRDVIRRMRRGDADDELGFPAKDFIDRLLDKALTGYLAHPDTWDRIGFGGPAYPDGYAWIGPAGTIARHRKAPGWERL